MKKIKAFLTRDDTSISSNELTAPVYELSDIGQTYSKVRKTFFSQNNPSYSLQVFKIEDGTDLNQTEVTDIIELITSFVTYVTANQGIPKMQAIAVFTSTYNIAHMSNQLTDLDHSLFTTYSGLLVPNYVTFTLGDVQCLVWMSDDVFKVFYPDYDINIVLPSINFTSIIGNPSNMISMLDSFDLIEFNGRIEENKENKPTTYTRILNIPYKVPSLEIYKNCYFGFNIYGQQGNYNHVLKLELYHYLTVTLGLDETLIQTIFPSILNINEFFIVPRWDRLAIPTQVGQNGIGSQISLTYEEEFTTDDFIKVHNDVPFFKSNTYNVPVEYDNLLLQVTNGKYTELAVRDFKEYYHDLITVTSIQSDFAKMSTRTQRFVIILNNILNVADSSNQFEMFTRMVEYNTYTRSIPDNDNPLGIMTRNDVTYLTVLYEDHQYYILPKYQLTAILGG